MAYSRTLDSNGIAVAFSTTVTSTAFSGGVATGDMVVGAVVYASAVAGGPLTVVDNNSVAQNVIISAILNSALYMAFFWKQVTSGAPTSFTATKTGASPGSGVIQITARAFTGFSTGAGLDPGGSSKFAFVSSSTASNSMSTGSITTNVNGDFVWSFLYDDTAGGTAFTQGTVPSYTLEYNNADGGGDWSEWLTQAAAGSVAGTWQATTVTGDACYLGILALTQTTPPSGCPHTLSLLGVGCSVGWRAALLGGAAWRAGRAIEENGIITRRGALGLSRRSLLLGHNGGPPLDDWK